MRSAERVLGFSSASLVIALALGGCAAPSSAYMGPRTTPKGRFNALVAPQALKPISADPTPSTVIGLRGGLAKRLDFGARTTLRAVAIDVKWNAVQSDLFDLSLDAG